MSLYSTAETSPERRVEYWNDAISETFTQLVSDPVHSQRFQGSLETRQLGDVRFGKVRCDGAAVRHTQNHIRATTEDVLLLHFQLDGQSVNRQCGAEARLETGTFTFCDSTDPYSVCFNDRIDMLVMRMPQAKIARRIRNWQQCLGRKFHADRGAGKLMSGLMSMAWREDGGPMSDAGRAMIADSLLDLVAATIAEHTDQDTPEASVKSLWRARIEAYIDRNLTDPGLTPQSIAAALGISRQYVHAVVKGVWPGRESLSRRILRLRLERCAEALANPCLRHRSVSSIGFEHGFESASHFSRAFKERYRVGPRAYRSLAAPPLS